MIYYYRITKYISNIQSQNQNLLQVLPTQLKQRPSAIP